MQFTIGIAVVKFGIDPLEIIDKYGADALRFSLATGIAPGSDTRFTDGKIESCRNFVNKLWNASRFVIMNIKDDDDLTLPSRFNGADKWILTRLNDVIKEVTINLNKYEIGLAAARLYDFVWSEFCDWYIEIAKIRLNGEDAAAKATAKAVLVYVMSNTLKLLHPFMPFITEEIWQTLPHEGESIMISAWPETDSALCYAVEESEMERIMTAIKAVRNRRAEMNVPPSKKSTLYVVSDKGEIFRQGEGFICRLAYADKVIICETDPEGHENMVCVVTNDAKLYIPLEELIDFEKELARLEKEKANCLKQIAMFEGKLSNEAFVSRAPEKVVAEQREKLEKNRALLAQLEESEKRLRR